MLLVELHWGGGEGGLFIPLHPRRSLSSLIALGVEMLRVMAPQKKTRQLALKATQWESRVPRKLPLPCAGPPWTSFPQPSVGGHGEQGQQAPMALQGAPGPPASEAAVGGGQ